MVLLSLLAGAPLLLVDCVSAQATSPYPASPVIKGISFDWSTHIRLAQGSDNWPITWAADGHQYTVWGTAGASAAPTAWAGSAWGWPKSRGLPRIIR